MRNIEYYKLAGAVLVAALVIQVARVAGDHLVSPKEGSTPAMVAATPPETAAAPAASEKKAPATPVVAAAPESAAPAAANEKAAPATSQGSATVWTPPQETPQEAAKDAAQEAALGAPAAAAAAKTVAAAKTMTAATTPSAGNAEAGKAVFKKYMCFGCHKLAPGKNGVGPSLAGIVGRKAGTAEGYGYSKALKNSGIVWSEANLDEWLQGPKKMVKGTRMILARPVKSAADRENLIAYLKKAAGK